MQSHMFLESHQGQQADYRDGQYLVLTNMDRWFICSTHRHERSHRGRYVPGLGTCACQSIKTETKLKKFDRNRGVAVSKYVPCKIWLINFMEEQGYRFKDKVLFQDNMSGMKMEQNCRNLCTSIRYFFVKDRSDKKEFRFDYCPMGNMIADYFTKPLQGALFNKFRAIIMG